MQDMDVRLIEDVRRLFHNCNEVQNNLHKFSFLTPCDFETVIQVMLNMRSSTRLLPAIVSDIASVCHQCRTCKRCLTMSAWARLLIFVWWLKHLTQTSQRTMMPDMQCACESRPSCGFAVPISDCLSCGLSTCVRIICLPSQVSCLPSDVCVEFARVHTAHAQMFLADLSKLYLTALISDIQNHVRPPSTLGQSDRTIHKYNTMRCVILWMLLPFKLVARSSQALQVVVISLNIARRCLTDMQYLLVAYLIMCMVDALKHCDMQLRQIAKVTSTLSSTLCTAVTSCARYPPHAKVVHEG